MSINGVINFSLLAKGMVSFYKYKILPQRQKPNQVKLHMYTTILRLSLSFFYFQEVAGNLKFSFSSDAKESMSQTVRFVLAVAAGKGGVGKSTLTVNLALALQKKGWQVGILDADLYGPSLQKMLPPDTPPQQSLADPQRIIPAQSSGIKEMSYAFFSQDEEAAIVRAPIANRVIKQFLHQVDWAPLDCLLIDFPPGTGDIQLTLMQEGALSGGVIVTTPQEVALLDVTKAIQMFDRMQIPILGIVENMSFFQEPGTQMMHYPFGKEGGKRLSKRFGIPFLGEIPIDSAISHSSDAGQSLLDVFPDASSVCVFQKIAQDLIEQLEAFEHLEGDYLKNFELNWQVQR
jgi:ATP-binding protein involved in chromosome partitioning